MGPPPTSHFHILADTPAGLQGINPPKTAQPSAARTYYDVDGKRVVDPKETNGETPEDKDVDKKPEIGTDFGTKTDQYDQKTSTGTPPTKKGVVGTAAREWTDQETLLLLEGLFRKILFKLFPCLSGDDFIYLGQVYFLFSYFYCYELFASYSSRNINYSAILI